MADADNSVEQPMPEGAVADQANPFVPSLDQFRDVMQAQERAANAALLDRLANQFPAVAALIAERNALLAKLADTPTADADSAPAESSSTGARKGRR